MVSIGKSIDKSNVLDSKSVRAKACEVARKGCWITTDVNDAFWSRLRNLVDDITPCP